MKLYIFSLITIMLCGCSNSLVGKIVPPYPNKMYSQNGACISGHLGHKRMCEYSVGLIQSEDDQFTSIVAKRSTKKQETDPNTWIVTDQIEYPDIQEGTWLIYGSCMQNGKFDETILAVVLDTNTEFQQATQWVWKVDLETGLFVKISPEKVLCVNEGWGL